MSELFDLNSMVDKRVMADQDAEAARAFEDQQVSLWELENREILEQLQLRADALDLPEIVQSRRETLQRLKRFNNEGMVTRRLSWMPDTSAATATTAAPARIRAICGDAVLLNSRPEGVEGNFLERTEEASSLFYALAIAVEQDDKLMFYRLFTGGPNQKALYDVLSEKRYARAVERYNQGRNQFFWSNEFTDDRTPGKLTHNDTLAQGMHSVFKRRMAEIAATPTVSSDRAHTEEVYRLILGDPAASSNESYSDRLTFLLDWERNLDRQRFSEAFEEYLGNSAAVATWSKPE